MNPEEVVIRAYIENKLYKTPELEPYIGDASILWTENDPGLVWDLMLLLPDDLFRYDFSYYWSEYFVVDDHDHIPAVFTRAKSFEWLRKDFASRFPIALWIYQNAVVLVDKERRFNTILQEQQEIFARTFWEILRRKYLEFRTERHNLRDVLKRGESTAIDLIKTTVVKLALEISFLAEGKPYPYKKWLPWAVQYETRHGKKILQISQKFLDAQDPAETIEISDWLVGEIASLLAETEKFSEEFIQKWWLYLS